MNCDFHEVGSKEKIPQLNFIVPVAYAVTNYRYDVPFGTIDRASLNFDVPANSFAVALSEESSAVMLITDSKYGFRGTDNSVSVDLIRASTDPDPYPEYGVHNTRIGVCMVPCTDNKTLFCTSAQFIHPITIVSARKGDGTLPMNGTLAKIDGNVKISAIKTPEDTDGLIIRLSDACGKGGDYNLTFSMPIKSATLTDINEIPIQDLKTDGAKLCDKVEPYGVRTILFKF